MAQPKPPVVDILEFDLLWAWAVIQLPCATMMGPAALLCVARLVPAVAGVALDNDSIKTAVALWHSDRGAAEAAYGHISTWETGGVTNMFSLFAFRSSFNEDIGAWDTSGVTSMEYMFFKASAFNKDIGGWDTSGVTTM